MPRSPIHLVLITALVVVPAVQVLCAGSCTSEDVARQAARELLPDCHEHGPHESGSAPQDGDCRHAGEASWSSLSAKAKSAGADGLTSAVGSTPIISRCATTRDIVDRAAPLVLDTGQSLGLFFTPLRI